MCMWETLSLCCQETRKSSVGRAGHPTRLPPKERERVGSFISVTSLSAIFTISCRNDKVQRGIGWRQHGKTESKKQKKKKRENQNRSHSRGGRESWKRRGGLENERDIYSSAPLTALRLRCSFLFSPTSLSLPHRAELCSPNIQPWRAPVYDYCLLMKCNPPPQKTLRDMG